MADFDSENKPRPKGEVIIEDLRHRRDVDDIEGQEEAEPVAENMSAVSPGPVDPETQTREGDAPREFEGQPVAATGAEDPTKNTAESGQGGRSESHVGEGGSIDELAQAGYDEDEIRAMEREQLRQIIGLGLVNYLKYQLTMVLNFALLSMGSAPDPTTGLVTKDLPQAKLAIDVLEFLVARLQTEMSVAERQQMSQLVSDLKYSFMQAVAADAGGPAGGIPGGSAGEA